MPLQPRIARGALTAALLALLIAGCKDAGADRQGGADPGSPAGDTAPSSGQGGDGSGDDASDDGDQGRKAGSGNGAGQALARCHTDQLRGRLRALDPGAGNRFAALVLTNESDRTCRTFGWVGLQLASPGDKPVPTRVVRTGKPRGLVLKAGQSAWSRLQWTVVPTGDEPDGACERTPTALLVIPPDETTQLTTEWRYGAACDRGKITATPLASGSGPGG